MRNKKLIINLLNIGGIGILVGGIYLIAVGKWKKANVDISVEDANTKEDVKIAYGNGEMTMEKMLDKEIAYIKKELSSNSSLKIASACVYYDNTKHLMKMTHLYPFKNSKSRQEYQSSIYKLVGEKCENLKNKNNIASKAPLKSSDNNLERDDRTNITVLTLPVETRGGYLGGEIVSTDYVEFVVPTGPSCSDLADRAQQGYNESYNQGNTPVRVQFYGTNEYKSVPLNLVENGEHENVYIFYDFSKYGGKPTYRPIRIVCDMKNASFVEYLPTGNRYCSGMKVWYSFKENSIQYGKNSSCSRSQ